MTKTFDYIAFFKKAVIIATSVILIGAIATCIFGVNFNISFVGGSRFTYTYKGDLSTDSVKAVLSEKLGITAEVTKSSDYSGDTNKLLISLSGDIKEIVDTDKLDKVLKDYTEANKETNSSTTSSTTSSITSDTSSTSSSSTSSIVSSETSSTTSSATSSGTTSSATSSTTKEEENVETMVLVRDSINAVLDSEQFKANEIKLSESNTVNPTLAGEFLIKSLVAVAIAAGFIILYVSLRFRNIGGFSAAVCSLVALVHDVIIAFISCVIFGLEIDTNFFAVVLTLFGYSLNSTIVMFDRVRENKKHFGQLSIIDNVNKSLRETFTRSVFTAFTTFLAITAIAVVAEFFGVSALRSFAIPMVCGIIAGTFSSLFIAGPMWVKWSDARAAKESK